ncbi:MAG TPA: NlpC/P60 family protein [Lentzea sp.]
MVLRTAVLVAVIALSGAAAVRVAVEQQQQEGVRAGVARARPDEPGRDYRFERLNAPPRTVVRDEHGAVVATFTDGARTAAITGPSRTFAEPARTPAVVTTPVWARLIPQPWRPDAEREEWFRPWLDAAVVDRGDDVLAIATQYLDEAQEARDEKSVRYRGNASFGPADFHDYLGVSWSFPDGGTENPAQERYGSLDAAGFIRLVFGYRLGYPLRDSAGRGTGLPRTPAAMATFDTGVQINGTRLALQPGDLLFFDTGRGVVDHVGLFVGLDRTGKPRFVSSRRQAEGPTLGDEGASFTGLRGARRL